MKKENKRKNCLRCAESFIPKRSDAIFCTDSCRAKYSRLKKAGTLNGLNNEFNVEQEKNEEPEAKPEFKEPQILLPAKTVDAIDLEPFMNTLGDDSWDIPPPNKEKDQTEISKEKADKAEAEIKTDQPKKNLPQTFITKIIKTENPAYKIISEDLAQCRKDIKLFKSEIVRLTQLIQHEKDNTGSGYILAGAGVGLGGSLLYDHFQTQKSTDSLLPDKILEKDGKPLKYYRQAAMKRMKKPEPENKGLSIWGILFYGALGTGAGAIAKAATKEGREKEKAKKIREYNKEIEENRRFLSMAYENKARLFTELNKHPAFFETEKKLLNPNFFSQNLFPNSNSLKAETKPERIGEHFDEGTGYAINPEEDALGGINDNKQDKNMKKNKELETDKIKSMDSVSKERKPLLNFQGKWKDFLGQPQTNFFCVMHGLSGSGKSHLAMQFGKYLALNFGNVLYVSGEEGFSVTFQKKIEATGANVPRFYATQMKKGGEILKDVPNRFHFIIIDSINNMGIDPDLMNTIRSRFNKSGIIAICQSTKAGEMRGSYQIVHDSDIAIKVINGTATTTKNRFHAIHQDFDAHSMYRKKKDPATIQLPTKNDELDEDFDNTIR